MVASFPGDKMLAYFGYPQATEQDPEQAVRAGLELVNAIGQLDGRGGRLRLGIATGPAVVGDLVGQGDPEHVDVVGETRNLASALRQSGHPNAVIIAASTRRLIGRLFDCRERDVILEGLANENRVWEVLRPNSVESRFEALNGSSLALIDREQELELPLRRPDGNG
jgi:class 3 adenylate cyclase